ncbi:hypothetical protein, partial [Pyramidobacter piscolens]|uniref:hypothetical protein n=1 Tax=Pyramidobacter piscolens TaxID=638849 RepID=UPI003AF93F30
PVFVKKGTEPLPFRERRKPHETARRRRIFQLRLLIENQYDVGAGQRGESVFIDRKGIDC